MKERQVWKLVPRPEGAKILGNRWVFAVKRDEKGEIVRFKARLVAQGFRQRKGETYEEVFSPVVNFAIIRLFFSILVNYKGWEHCQADIKAAYLYAPLTEKVYMSQPKGFIDTQNPESICLLQRAIYGLKQSGREWFYTISNELKAIGFIRSEWSNGVYYFKSEAVLLLYVDDIVILGKTKHIVKKVLNLLQQKYDMKILGKTKLLLGVEFEEINGKVCIHQQRYITKICQQFKHFNPPVTSLPIVKGIILSKAQCPTTEEERQEMEKLPYRSVIGCLSFLCSRTRPDISYAVNILSQFQENPGLQHWNCLIKLLGYVSSSRNLCLDLSKVESLNLHTYSDADFANNRDDRTSMGGVLLLIDRSPILWRTFKQKCTSLSTMEAEYISLTEAAKETVWILHIIDECYNMQIVPDLHYEKLLFCDNSAAIDFSKSAIENSRSKHIDVRYHFLRDLVYSKIFTLKYINTKSNLADILTKPLPKFGLKAFNDQVFKM